MQPASKKRPPTQPKPTVLPLLLSLSLTISTHTLVGQTTPPNPAIPEPEEEAVVLSPFEVTEDQDTGYASTSTLAGNRINTSLRDVGSAISVFNQQFLRDLQATSNESLLQYTTNTEVGNIYGNMANAGSGTQLDETRNFVAPNSNTRVRGLAAADNTIDFFLTDLPWDSYNVDRVEMQRGPNAILFGLGSPAGIINAGTKQAGFKNHGQVEARYSRFGSLRTTVDLNYVLLPDQLAIRVDALRDKEQFQQEPAFQRDERIYAAIRYEPAFLNRGSAKTTFKANYENGRIRSNRPRAVPPGDLITPWFYTGTVQGFNSATGAPVTYNNLNRIGFNASGLMDQAIASAGSPNRGQFVQSYSNGTLNPYWQPWLAGGFTAGYFGNPGVIFDSGASSGSRLVEFEPTAVRGIGPTGAIDGNIGGIPFSRMSTPTGYRDFARKIGLPGAIFGLTRNLVLTDPSVFDFYNLLIDGPNKAEGQNFDKFNTSLSQTFFNGDVGVEGAYDRQHYDNGQLVFMSDKGQGIYTDVNEILADGTVNPNFGRPFIGDGQGANRTLVSEREASRVTAFLRHDFAKNNDSLLTRIVGRQQLTAYGNKESRKTDSRSFVRYSSDLAYKDFVFGPNANINFDSSQRAPYPLIYLGPSLKDRTSASGAYIPNPTAVQVAQSGSIRVFDSTWAPAAGINPGDVWLNPDYPEGNTRRTSTQSENPANYRGWVNVPIAIIDSEKGNRDALTTGATLTKNTVDSRAFVYNGYFWDGAIVGMYGWRTDTSKAWTRSAVRVPASQGGSVNLDPGVYRLPDNYRDRIHEHSKSWSVVAHLSQFVRNTRLPLDVSLFYNKSNNFAATAGRVGPLNENLGPPAGNTKDVGVVIATNDGKYSLKLNTYKSTVKNASSSGFNIFYLRQFFTDYHPWVNVFKYRIDGTIFDLSGTQGNDPNRWTWQSRVGQTPEQAAAEQTASITAWETMIGQIPREFFTAYNIAIDRVGLFPEAADPAGLTVTEDNVSKGYEIELAGQPVKNLRLSFNASKSEATRQNVGEPSLLNLIQIINSALNTSSAGLMRNSASGTAATALTAWNNNFYAPYISIKAQEGGAVPELRKWRANFVANYDFKTGFLKNVSVGAGYRWQSKVILGYAPLYVDAAGNPAVNPQLAKAALLQIDQPFYGPAESNVDLWIGYKHQLTKKISTRTQLNVSNVGKGNDLIPITVQPDGTPVGYRIAPTQIWRLTTTFDF